MEPVKIAPLPPPSPPQARERPAPSEESEESAAPGISRAFAPAEQPADDKVGRIAQLEQVAQEAFSGDNVKLSIEFDKASGLFVYRGLDRETGEVVREYPPEEVLERLARRRMDERGLSGPLTGLSFDTRT